MRLNWTTLDQVLDGGMVEVRGYPLAPGLGRSSRVFLLVPEPYCCVGHAPRDRAAGVEVESVEPIVVRDGQLSLTGRWSVRHDDPDGWRYRLTDARVVEPPGWRAVTRRRMLAVGPLMCLAACAEADPARKAAALAAISAGPAIDVHSHAGHIAGLRRIQAGTGFSPIAEPMRRGGMAAICLAMVSDSPTHHVTGGRIRPYRDPAAGELYQYGMLGFRRVHALVRQEGLHIIKTPSDLTAEPGVIIAAEGADFLEGRIERVDEAYHRWHLRHLQLTHYRVNELGDIQTEPPVHGGLTRFGTEVIRRCNRLGIVVDIAHAPLTMVRQAAEVSRTPLVLSHTSMLARPGPTSRQITAEHAKAVAATGGVIGVWPVIATYPTLQAMAVGIARLADIIGVDHVALGTDLRGLTGGSVIGDYNDLPEFAEAMLGAGLSGGDVTKVLGGNYARVFRASLLGGG